VGHPPHHYRWWTLTHQNLFCAVLLGGGHRTLTLLNSAQSFQGFAAEIDKFNIRTPGAPAIGGGPETKSWMVGVVALADARALARRRGITVNGLAIEIDVEGLHLWYQHNLITGADSFVEVAANFDDFKQAIVRKLLRELSDAAFSGLKQIELAGKLISSN
jgi:hypothetical protein